MKHFEHSLVKEKRNYLAICYLGSFKAHKLCMHCPLITL